MATQCPKCQRLGVNTTCPVCVVPTVEISTAETILECIMANQRQKIANYERAAVEINAKLEEACSTLAGMEAIKTDQLSRTKHS